MGMKRSSLPSMTTQKRATRKPFVMTTDLCFGSGDKLGDVDWCLREFNVEEEETGRRIDAGTNQSMIQTGCCE